MIERQADFFFFLLAAMVAWALALTSAAVPAAARAAAGPAFGRVLGSATYILKAVPGRNFGTAVDLSLIHI